MSVKFKQFWQAIFHTGLMSRDTCQQLAERFLTEHDQDPDVRKLAVWLVKQQLLSAYQAKLLLAESGRDLIVGELRILDIRPAWLSTARRRELLHLPTGHRLIGWRGGTGSAGERDQQLERGEQARQLRHPNLDRCYGSQVVESEVWTWCEWPEGNTAAELVSRRGKMSAAAAVQLVHQAALAVGHLHAAGTVHGRLNLSDLIIQPGGHVRLLRNPVDLPLSGQDWRSLNSPPAAVAYLAPEFLLPAQTADALTDIYSLGAMLYHLISGRTPFDGETAEQMLDEHATRRLDPLEPPATVPDGLEKVIAFMMAKQRQLRYSHVAEVIEQLEPFLPSGLRQTTARSRATETAFLEQLAEADTASATTGATVAEFPPVVVAAPASPSPAASPAVSIQLNPATSESTSPSLAARFRPPKKSYRSLWLPAAVALLSLIAILAILLRDPPDSSSSQGHTDDSADATVGPLEPAGPARIDEPAAVDEQNAEPDVELAQTGLWASPTNGPPIVLDYAPAGAQVFLCFLPESLNENPQGRLAIEAMQPLVTTTLEPFSRVIGRDWRALPSVVAAWAARDTGPPVVSVVVAGDRGLCSELRQRVSRLEPHARGEVGRLTDAWAALFPTAADDTVVLGDATVVAELAEAGSAAPLRREIEQLRRVSDATRHFTMLFAPNVLLGDGRNWLPVRYQPLRDGLLSFVGEQSPAVLLSLHVGEGSYAEVSWMPRADARAAGHLEWLNEQLQSWPIRTEELLARRAVDPVWQPLAERTRSMVDFAVEYARIAQVGRHFTANVVGPSPALHNLLLAADLTLGSPSRSGTGDPGVPATEQRTVEQWLALPADLVVEQQALDAVVSDLVTTLQATSGPNSPQITIVGADLQLDGITRNQQIRNLDLRARPLRELLTALVSRANPIQVDDAKSAAQKLIWVVSQEGAQGGGLVVLITTRTAARQKGYAVPAEFVAE
ncbi:MAG: protein kinase [Planctomycetales bacterium]|nr:protein kinase [Planctomycetales bacterium]